MKNSIVFVIIYHVLLIFCYVVTLVITGFTLPHDPVYHDVGNTLYLYMPAELTALLVLHLFLSKKTFKLKRELLVLATFIVMFTTAHQIIVISEYSTGLHNWYYQLETRYHMSVGGTTAIFFGFIFSPLFLILLIINYRAIGSLFWFKRQKNNVSQ